MAPVYPFLQTQNNSLTNRPWRRTTDSNIVMAISSPQDVVNNPQSMEAQPVDILGKNDATAIPYGANETATTSDDIHNNEASPPSHDNDISNKDFQSDGSTAHVETLDPSHSNLEVTSKDREVYLVDDKVEVTQISAETQDNEAFEYGSVKSAGFDGSLGSDTETAKADVIGNGKDTPRYAAKKPAGFKPVSITKSFLAKAGMPILPLKAIGDKGVASPSSPAPGSATSATRPRLVAKTLSSSRSAAPMTLNSTFKQVGTDGPDPNQVWNRNRVQMAPQATPKHMTDEELRQQYGIQLASRPLEGGDSNQAKWADLEDEDEDWAPETLEWSDGTKINLAPSEPSTPINVGINGPNLEHALAQAAAEKAASTPKISLGPKATVLKLGGGAMQLKSPPLTSVVSAGVKSTSEKPTLVAKPSPAPPAKSPWAQLPPVDKASPIGPPVQTPLSRFPHREGYNRDSMSSHPLQPTREIAADDYSRFPANGTPRELFNSHNGRYEPAPEARRLSMKKEAGFRAPAVLQRPLQNDNDAAGESSPMLQHHRNLQDPSVWRRRRASSNVSNDSGGLVHRMSINRAGPDGWVRRDSVQEQSVTSGSAAPYSENRVGSPAISHGRSATSQQSPMGDPATMVIRPDHYSSNQTPGTPMTANMDAELARQKKLMRERAEAAMKRRNEEEAKEEAEKRERLRLKLQELEPQKSAALVSPVQSTVLPSVAEIPLAAQGNSIPASQPKPPVANPTGEPQQYGLMKLHGVNQSTKTIQTDGRLSQPSPPQDLGARNNDLSQMSNPRSHLQLSDGNVADAKSVSKPIPTPIGHQLEKEKSVPQGHRMPNQSGSAVYQSSAWGQGSVAPHSTAGVNVWAAPGSQKTLGNGDFQKNVTQIHLPPVTSQQYPQHLVPSQTQPQPIGTPRKVAHNQSATSHVPVEHQVQGHQYPADLSLHPSHPRAHPQLPILPKEASAAVNLPSTMSNRPTGISAWGDFAKNASVYDAQKKAQIAAETAAFIAERERAGLPANLTPVIHETWTQVTGGDTLGSRPIVNTTINSTINQRDLVPIDTVIPSAAQGSHMRSRYKDLFDQNERSVVGVTRPEEPLTPPPEEGDHPVFFGGAQRPKVRLPGSISVDIPDKPIPIVCLPAADAYNLRPIAQSSRLPLSPLRHQPLVNNSMWQERFNGLLGNGATPQKRYVEGPEFSMSKEIFEFVEIPQTSVSLPAQESNCVESVDTKSVEEEIALLEEGRDFGSVPPVRIPTQAPIQAWNPPRIYKDMKRVRAAVLADDQVHTLPIFSPNESFRSGEGSIFVKLPSMMTTKRVPYTRLTTPRQRPSFQGARGGKARHISGQNNGGIKARETSAPVASVSPGSSHSNGRLPQHGSGSRKPSSHGHGGNWSSGTKRSVPPPAAVH